MVYYNDLSRKAALAQKNIRQYKKQIQAGFTRVFEKDQTNIEDNIREFMNNQTTQDYVKSLTALDILERKPIYQ